MSASHLERMESLFHAALARPAGERAEFLAAEESDAELRAAVERLLAHHTECDASLRDALNAAVIDCAPTPARERIGAYRLLREIGAGGMGTVFLAERTLGETRQRVALKLIRGFPTAEARARLARERTLLAELSHPNIARLFDGGDSEDGQPYLVMEYIDGEPLLAYCASRALGIEARLALFVQLCRAVQHAHQHLIVHRDIKPANVLVREDGTPVLLDFGIGKLLDGTDAEAAATRVFTPAYAAPEQREGRHATTASDVYALGCVLFELLAGGGVSDLAADATPPRPSAAASDPQIARRLRGDLDRIVLKATERQPERRYASADALAEDVGRYLAGRPVNAVPDSVAYRTRKYVERHRWGVLAAIVVVLMTAAFVWSLALERSLAVEQASRAAATRDFLVSLFRFADPGINRGKPPTVHELLDQGRAQLDTGLAAQPALRGELNFALAQIYEHLAEHDDAQALAKSSLALTAGDDVALRAERLALLATAEANGGRSTEALAHAEQALGALPDDGEAHTLDLRLGLLNTKAMALKFLDRADEAAATMREVLALLPRLGEKQHEHRAYTLDNLAHVEEVQGHYTHALRYAAEAEAAFVALRGQAHPEPLAVGAYRAGLLAASGDLAGAEAKYREVLAAQQRLYSDDNDRRLTNTETYLARVLLREDRAADALPLIERAQARCERMSGADHVQCPVTRQIWGETKVALGEADAGLAALREAVALRDADPDGDARSRNLARVSLARGQCLVGDTADGGPLLESVRAPLLAMPITSALERSFIERVGRECAMK